MKNILTLRYRIMNAIHSNQQLQKKVSMPLAATIELSREAVDSKLQELQKRYKKIEERKKVDWDRLSKFKITK
jgi:uncharacterized FlgJ-related protein